MRVSMSPKAMVKLSDEQHWRMVFLVELGLSYRGIAKILMISRCAIANTLKKYQKAGSVADLPQSGRPRKTTLWQDRRIVRMSLKNRKNTAVDLRREINSELSKPDEKISESTVRNRLKEANLNGQVAHKKPYLQLPSRDTFQNVCLGFLKVLTSIPSSTCGKSWNDGCAIARFRQARSIYLLC